MVRTDPGGATFDIVLRGYDRRQVDERLRFLGAELAAAEQALGAAQERTAEVEDELARVRLEVGMREPATPVFGDRVERILRLAAEEAEEVRNRAAEEATATVREARLEAQRLLAEANAVAKQRQEEAERELHRLHSLREEVAQRLQGTRNLLDEHLTKAQWPPGHAGGPLTENMDGRASARGEES
ncbi:MAG: DivIVA domain-containing protein [Actinomycetota bacterium]|nr:DivIVA domain-containing protein [Actinomycetota bacterium]